MAAASSPWVKWGPFISEAGRHIGIDWPASIAWLSTAMHFYYRPDHMISRCEAKKERRRHDDDAYGCLKSDQKLPNIVLGKAEQLTKTRLDQAGERILQKARQQRVMILVCR